MNYASIKKVDVANGPGVRVSLFVSGCPHRCRGCFNPEAWDFSYGTPFTPEAEAAVCEALRPPYIRGLTLLGGEPMAPANQAALLPFVRRVRALFPDKTIWCYTGYDYEHQLLTGQAGPWEATRQLLALIDVLVDGPYVQELRDPRLRFRGSSNQRIIDLRASEAQDQVILWEEALQHADH